MKADKKLKIQDIELNNPSMTVKAVTFDWLTNDVNIEIIFNEENGVFNHSRTFTFSNTGAMDLTSQDIYDYISTEETLKNFK
jgi:hypothetical protein